MSIDLTKYDNISFHPDEDINKKIKAYMLIFDYQVVMTNSTDIQKVERLKNWEKVFLKEEFYEIIPCLHNRRGKIEERIKHDNLSFVHKMAYKLSDLLKGIINNKEKDK